MSKLSDNQLRMLDAIRDEAKIARLPRREMEAQIRAELERYKALRLQVLSRLMNEARLAGVPTTKFSEVVGTKDYRTILSIMNLTRPEFEGRTVDAEGEVSQNSGSESAVYLLDGDRLTVTYSGHGEKNITGSAVFEVVDAEDVDGFLLVALTDLYNDDYTVRNDVVAEMETASGPYYEEVQLWLKSNSR